MNQRLVPRVFDAVYVTDDGTVRSTGDARVHESMQGQSLVPLIDGTPTGNAPGSPLCQVTILMENGKVSTPHVHDEVHVYVRLLVCGPQGVLTLYGDDLKHEQWLFANQTLWIPPGVPHVAVYPWFHDASTAVALETRTTPDWHADVRPLPTLWVQLRERLLELNLYHQVIAPVAADWPA